jgi:4-amino-4-deoxy-L-arabinose transferase-like glycosyltransferase
MWSVRTRPATPGDEQIPVRRWTPSSRALWIALALAITAYGGLLRYEALVANVGWMGQPRWSEALAAYALPVAKHVRPVRVLWGETRDPYVNGDPINYLKFAREMTHFYQGHVREPVFLAASRFWIWLCGWRDIGLSFSSAAGSTLAIFATYLLGTAVASPAVGAIAALLLAIEFHGIAVSFEGWRDDTFMFVVALTAAALIHLRQRPSAAIGALTGLAVAAACLTRITAVTFIVPAMVWICAASWREGRRDIARAVVAAAIIGAGLVAPYLINCWRVTGDPLIAINYHTRYYRHAEGVAADRPLSAMQYVTSKIGARPVSTLDTATEGIFVFPFENKWHGFVHWNDRLPVLLKWTSAAGLVMAAFSPSGRLLLLILFTSLVPYALTWSLGGGGEWRFTQPAYPFYLVAAAWIAVAGARWIAAAVRRTPGWKPERIRPVALRAAGTAAALAIAWLAHGVMPLFAARELVGLGEAVTLAAGHRDAWLFDGAWSPPVGGGGAPYRVAQAQVVSVRLPVAGRSDYWLTLRMDPAETASLQDQPSVGVFLDRRKIAQLHLTRDPSRMGAYRVRVSTDAPRAFSRLDLFASHTVPARDAGPYFASLAPDTPVAFRLWYVRVDPEIE